MACTNVMTIEQIQILLIKNLSRLRYKTNTLECLLLYAQKKQEYNSNNHLKII